MAERRPAHDAKPGFGRGRLRRLEYAVVGTAVLFVAGTALLSVLAGDVAGKLALLSPFSASARNRANSCAGVFGNASQNLRS